MLKLDFFRLQRNGVTHTLLAVYHLRSQAVRDKYKQSLEKYLY